MAMLRAATVSNQTGRKRKRKNLEQPEGPESATTTTTVPTKTADGGKKPRRTPKKDGERPSLSRNSSSGEIITTDIEWPPHFVQLDQTHRALNLTFTFFCTRKHLATTFDKIRTTVESHTGGRTLKVEDIAQIKTLTPRAINFAYVDEAKLLVDVHGDAEGIKNGKAKEFLFYQTREEKELEEQDEGNKEVLLFEYVDGDLKRQVVHPKTGEPTNAFRKLKNESLALPVFSQKQMMNLISKRNTKFGYAVNGFLNKCSQDGVDPTEALLKQSKTHIPVPSEPEELDSGPLPAKLPASIPKERKTIAEIITELKESEWYTGQIVPDGHRVFDPQPPVFGELNFQLSQTLVNALYNTKGINGFYAHQAEAINNLHNGHNVIVATSTSSGKSLIYQVPVLHALEQDFQSRAMYIFPTKALAQDQRRSMKDILALMTGLEDIVVETFDGDTPMTDRAQIRDEGRIIFTNPDMLHITILPQEAKWRTFLQNLKYVVVDELHVYNGLFGSHVAFIMRRLRRVCAAVGNHSVRFISCSATVANPEDHMKTIFGVDDVCLTDFDGSPAGRKEFVCWNTPFKDPGDPTSGRGDAMAETARLFCQLALRGVRVIAFCRIRKQCEVLLGAVRSELVNIERPELTNRVMAYRGGYNPQDRRKIEKEMFEGRLLGIVATNALELGIDIGALDAVISVGFPYTISNLRQQSGRAGRRNRDSLSVLLGDCFPTDQYFMENPDEIFTKPNAELQVDLGNVLVLEGHSQCAAYEMPLRPEEDKKYFGKTLPELAEERMIKDELGFYHCNERFRPLPSKFVSIRDTEDGHFAVVDITNGRNIVLEEVEPSRAFFTIYDGGIFLHQGNTYVVKEFSPERKIARVERIKVEWTTQQREYTDVDPIETESIRRMPKPSMSRAFHGTIRIRKTVFGFFKIDKRRRILDAVAVDNPPIIQLSKGMWIDIPKGALDILVERRLNVAGAIHAAEHAVLSLMPNFVVSMPGDVRTECKVAIKEFAKKPSQRKRPARLTFYDAKGGAGGCGLSTKAFEFIDMLLQQAINRVTACHCFEGCVECVCSEGCKAQNAVMSKAGGEVILKSLLGMEIDIDALPMGPETLAPVGIETVILAEEVRPRAGRRIEDDRIVDLMASEKRHVGASSPGVAVKEEVED